MTPTNEREQLAPGVVFKGNLVADIGSIEACQKEPRAIEFQASADILSRLRIGGRRQSQPGHAREAIGQNVETHIFGTEVMTPMADAMGLVDGEKRNRDSVE